MIEASHNGHWPSISLHGVDLHALTETQCVRHILGELDAQRGGWVVTANLDHVRRLVKDVSYKDLCEGASLIVADGMPLIWASRLQGTPLPERVAGANLIWSLTRAASHCGRRIFFLGGAPGTAEGAAAVFQKAFPKLVVAGTYCPPLGFEKDRDALAKISDALAAARPDIVFVALGSPKQEQLAVNLRKRLPAAWWLGVGISFSFVCGEVTRAPEWIQRAGLEWVHRLMQEPRRLARRYLVLDLPFAASLLMRATHARWRRMDGAWTTNGNHENGVHAPSNGHAHHNGNGQTHHSAPRIKT